MGQGCLISDAAHVSGETSQYPTGSHVPQFGVLGWHDPPTTAGFKGANWSAGGRLVMGFQAHALPAHTLRTGVPLSSLLRTEIHMCDHWEGPFLVH